MDHQGCLQFCKESSRRDFLRLGSLGLLSISLSQYLQAKSMMVAAGVDVEKKAKAQACILLWLEGGPSQIDTWDPKPSSAFKAISTNVSGIQISELLPGVAKHMDKLSIIRSVSHKEVDHGQGWYYNLTGHRPNPLMQFPSFGSIITKETKSRSEVPPNVSIVENGPSAFVSLRKYLGSAFLGPEYGPMEVVDPHLKDFHIADLDLPKSVSVERVADRRAFLNVVDQVYRQKDLLASAANPRDTFTDQALKMILSPEVKKAFDLSQESEKTKDLYGRDSFGQSVLLARRLVESGCRFVTAAGFNKDSGWDTHGKGSGGENDKKLRETLCPPLDQALSALMDDLEQRGLLESTVVIVMGEFGRTPELNQINGRDHWPFCFSVALGGGGIQGGQVVGSSDARGAYPADRPVSMGDIFATVYKTLGIDWTREYMSPAGRPIKIANGFDDMTGQPIKELI
jgi:hypothetical protein